jgi:hypothetical protein
LGEKLKGKHTQAAAVRHEVQERDTKIATYQRAVARLTAENKSLKESNRERRQSWAKRERELLTRLDAAAAPKIDALEMLIAQRTAERDETRREHAKLADRWNRAFARLVDHFKAFHGVNGTDALEAVWPIFGDEMEGRVLVIDRNTDKHIGKSYPGDQAMRALVRKQNRPAGARVQLGQTPT